MCHYTNYIRSEHLIMNTFMYQTLNIKIVFTITTYDAIQQPR